MCSAHETISMLVLHQKKTVKIKLFREIWLVGESASQHMQDSTTRIKSEFRIERFAYKGMGMAQKNKAAFLKK